MKQIYNNNKWSEADESFFDDIYNCNNNEFWIKCVNDEDKMDPANSVYINKLYQKNIKTKKWITYHIELYPDRLVRMNLTEPEES